MSIYRQFLEAARDHASKDAIWFFEGESMRRWRYAELLKKVDTLAAGLRALGLKPGDRFGLLAANGPYWPVLNFAVAREGIVLVPVHTTLSDAQVRKIFAQSRVRAVFLGPGAERFISGVKNLLPPSVSEAIFLDAIPPQAEGASFRRFLLSEVERLGEESLQNGVPPAPEVREPDLSTIMYTSGTTGEMKGVMLTHGNLIHNAIEGEKMVGGKQEHVVLSILPLSHAFERVAGLLGPLFLGSTVAYGRGLASMSEDMRRIHPSHLNVVPRLLEKMYEGIHQVVKKKGGSLERVFLFLTACSAKYLECRQRRSPKALLYWVPHQLANLLFYRRVRAQLGGRLDRFISGGAALDPRIGSFFAAVGIKILEGYGLTECSPIVTVSPGERPKIGSVGRPLSGVEVRIGPSEEILVRGPNVMRGYENNPEATREAIDAESWFHTGDQGFLDEEGYLHIKGRLKELIVTSYGKNIVPTVVERALETHPLLAQAVIFGHNRAYLVGLVVPSPEEAKKVALRLGLQGLSLRELCERPEFYREVEKAISQSTQELAHHERVKRFKVLPEEFSQERDLLTPTLKLKRKKIAELYQNEIESMY